MVGVEVAAALRGALATQAAVRALEGAVLGTPQLEGAVHTLMQVRAGEGGSSWAGRGAVAGQGGGL